MSVSTLTKEEKIALKKEEKALAKKREEIYNDMLERDFVHRKENKIAPSDVCISLKDINKIYPNHVQAVYDFNLDIKPHEFIVLVGPSGCGKSTTLRMIAGLEDITYGDLFISGKYANDLFPKQRDVAMVFQNYALYPNLTVYDNLAFSLKVRHVEKEEIERRVTTVAETLGLTDYLKRRPAALSGGQKQRVALGRAIVRNANVFLMDEPLSNLDAKLRVQMRSEIVKIHQETGATTVYVTHDQTEAMTMADRIVVMKDGYIQQIGTPKETYNNPSNLFVAGFIGSPAMNLIETTYVGGEIKFDNNSDIKLTKEQIEIHDNFYVSLEKELKEKLDEYNSELEKIIFNLNNPLDKKYNDKIAKVKISYQEKISSIEASIREYIKKNDISNPQNDDFVKTKNELISKLRNDKDAKISSLEETLKLKKEAIAIKNANEPVNKEKEEAKKAYIEKALSEDNLAYYYRSKIELTKKQLEDIKSIKKSSTHKVIFGIRPEDIVSGAYLKIIKNPSKPQNIHVSLCELLGNEYFIHTNFSGKDIIAKLSAEEKVETGVNIDVCFNLDHIHIFDPISGNRII